MNIFGVGGPELIAILIIMLVFAGPKRMIHWSYIMGQYVAKFRTIWSQTVDVVQKEFDQAGVDIKLPKQPPTRQNFNKAISDAMQPITQPLQDSLDEVDKDIKGVKSLSVDLNPNASKSVLKASKTDKVADKVAPKPKEASPAMGTWSGQEQPAPTAQPSSNGQSVDMGTWSSSSDS